jgi:undecaprenyl-diphosphatase
MILELNNSLFYLIYNFYKDSIWLTDLAIFFAKYLPYLIVILFFYNLLTNAFFQKENIVSYKKIKIFLFLQTILAIILSRGIITEFIRFFWPEKRPFDVLSIKAFITESGPGFPSGHAAFLFALAVILFFWNKKWGIIYFVLALLNGFARIYVGVHWPLDILGGLIVGTLSSTLIYFVFKKYLSQIY